MNKNIALLYENYDLPHWGTHANKFTPQSQFNEEQTFDLPHGGTHTNYLHHRGSLMGNKKNIALLYDLIYRTKCSIVRSYGAEYSHAVSTNVLLPLFYLTTTVP
jgi:hypothetical protein